MVMGGVESDGARGTMKSDDVPKGNNDSSWGVTGRREDNAPYIDVEREACWLKG